MQNLLINKVFWTFLVKYEFNHGKIGYMEINKYVVIHGEAFLWFIKKLFLNQLVGPRVVTKDKSRNKYILNGCILLEGLGRHALNALWKYMSVLDTCLNMLGFVHLTKQVTQLDHKECFKYLGKIFLKFIEIFYLILLKLIKNIPYDV